MARCTLRNITGARGCFVLAGPRSRDVLAKLTDAPLDNASFPWLTGQVMEVGLATDVYALRVNFVGALGWELHFPIEYAHHLFDALFAAGAEYGIGMVGHARDGVAAPGKIVPHVGQRPDARLHAARGAASTASCAWTRASSSAARRSSGSRRLACRIDFVTLEVHGVTDADPLGNEPLFDAQMASSWAAPPPGYYGHACARASPSAT